MLIRLLQPGPSAVHGTLHRLVGALRSGLAARGTVALPRCSSVGIGSVAAAGSRLLVTRASLGAPCRPSTLLRSSPPLPPPGWSPGLRRQFARKSEEPTITPKTPRAASARAGARAEEEEWHAKQRPFLLGAVVSVGALGLQEFAKSLASEDGKQWPAKTRDHLERMYGFFGVTTLSMLAIGFLAANIPVLLTQAGKAYAGCLASLFVTSYTDYDDKFDRKMAALAALVACTGVAMAPLLSLCHASALAYTMVLTAGLSAFAATTPNDEFWLGGPGWFFVGLVVLVIGDLFHFYPSAARPPAHIMALKAYGGFAVFSALLSADTAGAIKEAGKQKGEFDPMFRHSLCLCLDFIGLLFNLPGAGKPAGLLGYGGLRIFMGDNSGHWVKEDGWLLARLSEVKARLLG